MLIVRSQSLLDKVQSHYTVQDMREILDFLNRSGTFRFAQCSNGLFPAASLGSRKDLMGYQNVWVRDNVHVAHAHYVTGRRGVALKNARALAAFFRTQKPRFLKIIDGEADFSEPMNRPHIRFDCRGREIKENWSHAQNDALGYFLWFYCRLIIEGQLRPAEIDFDLLGYFALYFQAVHFWSDQDSGHWEEHPKVEASSIGVVTAGLRMMRQAMKHLRREDGWRLGARKIDGPLVDGLLSKGLQALTRILPNECVQRGLARRYDAALLFLIYPMDIVSPQMGDQILQDVAGNLEGDYGIRRYLGDSYWAADYTERLPVKKRSVHYHLDSLQRNALFNGAEEAQWCLFDPIVSIIYGRKYRKSGKRRDLDSQIAYLNRSLGQITNAADPGGAWQCPELYYSRAGRYVTNDNTPLLWTQANLRIALQCAMDSLS